MIFFLELNKCGSRYASVENRQQKWQKMKIIKNPKNWQCAMSTQVDIIFLYIALTCFDIDRWKLENGLFI